MTRCLYLLRFFNVGLRYRVMLIIGKTPLFRPPIDKVNKLDSSGENK